MNREELDQLFKTITSHENLYLNNSDYKPFPMNTEKTINGNSVIHLQLNECRKKTGNHKHSHIIIKKHSRFQNWPLHSHDWVEINYVYQGECTLFINNEEIHMTKGQLLLLDSNVIHTLNKLSEEDIVINIIIDRQFLFTNFFNRFLSDSIILNFLLNSITGGVEQNHFIKFESEHNERLHFFLLEFFCEWFSPSIVFQDIVDSLFTTILIELVNAYHLSTPKKDGKHSRTTMISILNYMEENYKQCTLEKTAAYFNFNPNYLSNLLKKQTGHSYQELIKMHRLKTAANLLKSTSMSVTDISHFVGYDNVNFFYKKFQDQYNCLPGQYRIIQRNDGTN